MTSQSTVVTDYIDEIAVVRLNRPAEMNAVNASLRAELTDTLYALEADDTVRAIVLTGTGERAFCAGQDLDEAATSTLAILLTGSIANTPCIRLYAT